MQSNTNFCYKMNNKVRFIKFENEEIKKKPDM